MKVALCLFGIVGGTAGKNGRGADVSPEIAFKHYRDHILTPNDVDVYFHTWSVNSGYDLKRLYNPADCWLQPQELFSNDLFKHRAHSRWCSTKKSIGLVRGEYDFIMLSRFDVAFFTDVDFSRYDPEYFYASHWNDVGNRENHQNGFLDFWFFGGAEIMRKFGNLYDRIGSYDVSQHKAAKQHAEFIGAKIKYTMYRGEDHEMVRRAILKCKE